MDGEYAEPVLAEEVVDDGRFGVVVVLVARGLLVSPAPRGAGPKNILNLHWITKCMQ